MNTKTTISKLKRNIAMKCKAPENELRKGKKEKVKKRSRLPNYHTFFSNVAVMPVSGTCNKLPVSIKEKHTSYI